MVSSVDECMYCNKIGTEAKLKDHELWCQTKMGKELDVSKGQ